MKSQFLTSNSKYRLVSNIRCLGEKCNFEYLILKYTGII